jgi:hypothetical protein
MTATLCRSAHLWALAAAVGAVASHGELEAQVQTKAVALRAAPAHTISLGLERLAFDPARLGSGGGSTDVMPKTVPQQAGGAFMNIGFVGIANAGWSSEADVPALELGDHDPRVRGFTIPNAELTLDGAVDPFFQGFVNIVTKLDEEGETVVELEEVFVLTTSLPGSLQIKAGQFFTEFGRVNTQHPHAWSFVDAPIVNARLLGPEGLRSQGMRLSWLAPTPFYAEAMVAVQNATGETTASFRSEESPDLHGGEGVEAEVEGLRDFLVTPRVTASFDPSDNTALVVGASAAFGPNNSGDDAQTRIFGADLYWKWKSPTAGQGFPFVSVQAEAMKRSYEAPLRVVQEFIGLPGVLPAETLQDKGAYAELLWGIQPRIVAGVRGDIFRSEESVSASFFESELRGDRERLSTNVTWYPSEFSKLRVQYNLDRRDGIGTDHSLWFQLEFILGAHAAHRF